MENNKMKGLIELDDQELAAVAGGADEVTIACPECGMKFMSRDEMLAHQLAAHPAFRCPECSQVFFSRERLEMHRQTVHRDLMLQNG